MKMSRTPRTPRTIKNLNKVLGIEDPPPLPVKVQPKPKVVIKERTFMTYPKVVELINGRCAIAGSIIGTALFKFSGETLGEQVFDHQDDTLSSFTALGYTVIFISILESGKYDEDSQLAQFEMFAGRWFMLSWLFILLRAFI